MTQQVGSGSISEMNRKTFVKARDVGGPGHKRDLHPPQRHRPGPDRQAGDGQQYSLRGGSPR